MSGHNNFDFGTVDGGDDLVPVETPSPVVSISNALARASHGLDVAEKRLIALAISKIDSRKGRSPLAPELVTKITAKEYSETFDVSASVAYRALAEAAKQLFHRYITFYTPAWTRKGAPLPPTRVMMHWVSVVKYQEGEGWCELHWVASIVPHLTGLKKQFTSYQLSSVSGLKSIYTWRLLELISRFQVTGWMQMTIEDFCESMEATEKQRKNFAFIRRKMIEPAVKELIEKDDWIIVWEPIYGGKKVKAVRFIFKKDPQGKLFDCPPSPSERLNLFESAQQTTNLSDDLE